MTYDRLAETLFDAFGEKKPVIVRGYLTVGTDVGGGDDVYVEGDPLKFYVYYEHSIGQVYHAGRVPPKPDLPVLVEKGGGPRGKDIIYGVDPDRGESFEDQNIALSNVGAHEHGRFSGMAYEIDLRLLQQLAVRPLSSGLTLYVNPGRYDYRGEMRWWSGGGIDITSLIPSTTGQHAWCIIGIDGSTSPPTLYAEVGTAQLTTLPLMEEDIINISFSEVALSAVKLRNGQTAFAEQDFVALNSVAGHHPETAYPPNYIDGLEVTVVSDSSITIEVGYCRDASNSQNIDAASQLTINPGTTGANGLDTGSLAANTWYYLWVISGASGVAGFMSTSATPTLPTGYTAKRRVGWARANTSSNLYLTNMDDGHVQYLEETDTGDFLVGNDLDVSDSSWTSIPCAVVLPPGTAYGKFSARIESALSTSPIIYWRISSTQKIVLFEGTATASVPNQEGISATLPVDTSQSAEVQSSITGDENFRVSCWGYLDSRKS